MRSICGDFTSQLCEIDTFVAAKYNSLAGALNKFKRLNWAGLKHTLGMKRA